MSKQMRTITRRYRRICRILVPVSMVLCIVLIAAIQPETVFADDKDPAAVPTKEVAPEKFEKSRVQLNLKRCRSNDHGVVLQWDEVRGAKEYQVYRSEERDGEYKEIGVTEETKFRKKTDGEYYYKVRATNGKEHSRWSLAVQIFCQDGYIKKMYYDEYGYTHFQIHVRNRTDRPAYFYGPGLYNSARTPLYRVYKYEINKVIEDGEEKEKRERIEYPYPLSAVPNLPMYHCEEVAAKGGEADIDLFIPWKLTKYGENGLGDELRGYEIEITDFPQQRLPGFVLSVTGDVKKSESKGRIDR